MRRVLRHQRHYSGQGRPRGRVRAFRGARGPAIKYASLENCRYEVHQAEVLMQRERVAMLDTTARSIEEIATTILHRAGVQRHIF